MDDTSSMTNAAEAAQRRRDNRRRRILADGESRLNKISGQVFLDESLKGEMDSLVGRDTCQPPDNYFEDPSYQHYPAQHFPPTSSPAQRLEMRPNQHMTSQSNPGSNGLGNVQNLLDNASRATQLMDNVQENNGDYLQFIKIRTILILILGVIVRISLAFNIGQQYVQSILNPFVAFEIAVFGYQRAAGMGFGEGEPSGLWVSLLKLIGMQPDYINTYKMIMYLLTSMLDDFMLFFFTFLCTHAISTYVT